MKYFCSWLILTLAVTSCSYATSSTVFVSDYGAYPDDNIDDTAGIQLAVDAAISSGVKSTVVFGLGTYNLSSAIQLYLANNLTVTGQGIDKTFLIGNAPTSIFTIQSCQGLTISSFSIDFDPVPFTGGYVVDVNDTYLDVQIQPPHQATINQKSGAILRYDPVAMRPAFGPNTYEIYQSPPNASTTLVSPGVLRIPISYPMKFRVGDPIVARLGSSNHVISGGDSQDLTMDSINVYTSWCMNFAVTRVRRLTINNYHVLPRNGRWMSTTADCLNILDAREYVHISDSTCSSMGDDGLNIDAMYFIVTEVINSTAVIIQTFAWTDTLSVGVGTVLEFSTHQQPFTPYTKGTIASIKDHDSKSRLFTFVNQLAVNINDYVIVSDVPEVIVKNLTIANNRARGMILQTRNVLVERSVLNQTSGPAILLQPSLYWYAGPGAVNVTLRENLFINNNEGIASEKGMISISPYPTQIVPVVQNIQISSSTFRRGNYSKAIAQAFNGQNIHLIM